MQPSGYSNRDTEAGPCSLRAIRFALVRVIRHPAGGLTMGRETHGDNRHICDWGQLPGIADLQSAQSGGVDVGGSVDILRCRPP